MNKKLVLFGAAAMLSVCSMVAFRGAKTLAEQTAEIASSISSKLDAFRTEQTAACDARVATEVETRVAAARATGTPAAPTPAVAAPVKGGKKPVTKGGKGGPKVDPLPQPAPPPPPTKTDPVKSRGGAVKEGDAGDVKARGGAVKEAAPGEAPTNVKKRGGAVKVEGGGK
jgi:hypothetical protein